MKEEVVMSLKWESFPSHLAVSLDNCYEKQHFVDISLVCKDSTVLKCHKMVLANSSSFFYRLLVANDHPHPMIILHDIEADDLKTIINFMYCGEIQVVRSEVRRLLKLAEILEVTGLRHIQTSELIGECNNKNINETSKKAMTVSRLEETRSLPSKSNNEQIVSQLKIDEMKSLSSKNNDHEINTKTHTKVFPQSKLVASSSQRSQGSTTTRKNEEIAINSLNQRLETGNSGISIININDMPSTSKGLQHNMPPQKRKRHTDSVSWSQVLTAISKDEELPRKALCIMDEVEITAKQPSIPPTGINQNEPLDRRKIKEINHDRGMKYEVYIKDEIEILSDTEEDDMDPLKVDEVEIENFDHSKINMYKGLFQKKFQGLM